MPSERRPKISIVTVCLNAEKTIRHTLESVARQNYPNLEYIIVDGVSTDGTLRIVDEYRKHIAKVVSEPDAGISDAFNKGARLATGDLIGYINANDYYTEGALARVAEAWRSTNPPPDILYGEAYFMEHGTPLLVWNALPISEMNLLYPMFCHQAMFVRKEVFDHVGYFDGKLKFTMDYDWTLRCLTRRLNFKAMPTPPVCYFSLEGATSKRPIGFLLECRQVAVRNGQCAVHANLFYFWKIVKYGLQNILLALGMKKLLLSYKTRMKKIYKSPAV